MNHFFRVTVCLIASLFIVPFLGSAATAQENTDPSGTWRLELPYIFKKVSIKVELRYDGKTVTGVYQWDSEEPRRLQNAKIDGKELSYEFEDFAHTKYAFSGRISGDEHNGEYVTTSVFGGKLESSRDLKAKRDPGTIVAVPPERVLDEKIRLEIRSAVLEEIKDEHMQFNVSGDKVEYRIDFSPIKECPNPKCGWQHRALDEMDVATAYDYPWQLTRSLEIVRQDQPKLLEPEDCRNVEDTIKRQLKLIDDAQSFDLALNAQLLDEQKRGYAQIDSAIARYAKLQGKTASIYPISGPSKTDSGVAYITVSTNEAATIYYEPAPTTTPAQPKAKFLGKNATTKARPPVGTTIKVGDDYLLQTSFQPKNPVGEFFAVSFNGVKSGPVPVQLEMTRDARNTSNEKIISLSN